MAARACPAVNSWLRNPIQGHRDDYAALGVDNATVERALYPHSIEKPGRAYQAVEAAFPRAQQLEGLIC